MSSTRAYREAMREFSGLRTLDIWNSHLGIADVVRRWGSELGRAGTGRPAAQRQEGAVEGPPEGLRETDGSCGRRTSFRERSAATRASGGRLQQEMASRFESTITKGLSAYRRTLSGDRRHLMDGYRYLHLARKVVGVGSVGTRCWVALFIGRDEQDPLFLQVKQAESSVLEPYLAKSGYTNHGQRVVEGQRLMQGASDILLGWDQIVAPDGVTRDFYIRQLWDWKVSADLDLMRPDALRAYAQICGWTLARAHARSGDPIAIAAYLGSGDTFDRAIASSPLSTPSRTNSTIKSL